MNPAFAFEHAVLGTIQAHAAVGAGERLLVAVSGGADSTTLLAVLEALRRRGALRVELAVAHLNHRMRGAASDRDADAVRALARRFALPSFVGESPDLATACSNREARARAARFAFLERTAREWGARRIALAHTRDDQAETVLLRLARGAGPASLGAMEVLRPDGIVRPLLEQPRSACIAYLRARGLSWVDDASNDDETFFRNRVRRRLLPALETELGVDVRQRLARLARQLREESALAEQRIAELLASVVPGAGLPIELLHVAAAGAPRLLHAWLVRAGVRASERQIAELLRMANGDRPSASLDLGRGVRVARCYGRLDVERPDRQQAARITGRAELAVPGVARVGGWQVSSELHAAADVVRTPDAATALLDAAGLAAPLCVRAPASGDRVRLAYGRRKLADILIDAKVPRQERRHLAVVSSGDDVLWVPGIVRSVVAGPSQATHMLTVLHAQRVAGE